MTAFVLSKKFGNLDWRYRMALVGGAVLRLFATGLGVLGLRGWRRKRKAV